MEATTSALAEPSGWFPDGEHSRIGRRRRKATMSRGWLWVNLHGCRLQATQQLLTKTRSGGSEAISFRPPLRPAPMPQGQPAPGRRAAQPGVQHSWLPLFCEQFAAPMGWACPAEPGSPPLLPQWRTRKSPQWERVALLHAQPPLPRH